jgi:folylpolyglutamate synthase/dihydropteroate synthase
MLEVGMGGRLDAVNVVDPDVAVVVSIGFDHMEYLGNSLEAIGREKAGIFRAGRPAVLGSRDPPAVLEATATALGAPSSAWARSSITRVMRAPGIIAARAGICRAAAAGACAAINNSTMPQPRSPRSKSSIARVPVSPAAVARVCAPCAWSGASS